MAVYKATRTYDNKYRYYGQRERSNSGSSFFGKVKVILQFTPLTILLLERLWVPFELGDLSSYLDVENAASSSTLKKQQQKQSSRIIPLDKLTETYSWKTICPPKTELVLNVQNAVAPNPSEASSEERKIPKIVHQTAKSRCVTPAFAKLTQTWKFDGYEYYFHDDDAITKLFQEMEFPEFPHLKVVLRNCVTNGTLKADLYRYLILWIYGGIYADFDSSPNFKEFSPSTTISPSDDGFFVVEQYHILSQWFMAVSPRHPLMYYAIQHSLLNLMQAEDTIRIGAHVKTGPHALHRAYIDFRKDAGVIVDKLGTGSKPVWSGTFAGTNNRSVTVVGKGENENQYITRLAINPSIRKRDYRKMGMVHFSKYTSSSTRTTSKISNVTCYEKMLENSLSAI